MTKKVTVPTVANGDWVTPAWLNTNLKQNMEALWPFIAAGDMVRASAADELERIAAGSNGQVLTMVNSTPAWASLPATQIIHTKGIINTVGTSQSTASSSKVNLTGASLDLAINRACTIIAFGNAVGYAGSGGGSYSVDFDLLIDGTAVGSFMTYTPYPGAVCVAGYKGGVAVGTRNIKVRFSSPFSITVWTFGAYVNVFAIPE